MRHICTSIVATLVLAGTSFAATINVPADYTTIQEAIDAASDGDEIRVAPGTYTGAGNQVVDMLGKAVWLHSSDGPEATIISGMDKRRGIRCENAEQNNTIIEGFTISDCQSSCCGAGISCYPGSPTIKNCIIIENHSEQGGGGIYCRTVGSEVSNPAIINCRIENNVAGSNGGGVYVNPDCSPTITGCTISGNTANADGGGISCYQSSPTLTNCTFEINTAKFGGGIYTSEGSPTITDCTISDNTATGNSISDGGGIYCNDSSPTITDCTISDNTATNWGGGISCLTSSSPTIAGCTITGNTASNDGGGISCWSGSNPTITDCTISDNIAGGCGGGIKCTGSTPTLANTVVCGNSPDQYCGNNYTDNGGNTIEEECDSDGDGVPDGEDAFPDDPNEWADSDGDGVGDNGDAFPNDPNEWADSDSDGVGDNSDVFPNDPDEWADSDGDGVGDNGDAFPNDPNEWADSDGDGVGDNEDTAPRGPCCVGTGCMTITQARCDEGSGTWLGEGGSCDDCPTTCVGDIYINGVVDINDLLIMLGNWGPCP
jgi:parallel beta-helix repeat protein/predicted outer membrane repeat protein